MMTQTLHNLISEFGAYIGIPDLAPDERRCCNLAFDDRVIGIQQPLETDRLVVYTVVGDLPVAMSTDHLRSLLTANLFWLGTAGATLSIDDTTNQLILARSYALVELDLDEFNRELELFLDTADAWAHRLDAWRIGIEPTASGSAEMIRDGIAC